MESQPIGVPETSLGVSPPGEAADQDGGEHQTVPVFNYLKGLPFWSASAAIAILLFLTAVEASIVTTALVDITNELGGLEIASWVVSSYLLGYIGVIVILAKLSDILGRKQILLASALLFTTFSGACAAATTIVQLIVFRAFQGVGGGGCLAMTLIVLIELVPPEIYGKYVTQMNIAVAVALVLGPFLGGLISSNTTWKWIFLINVPLGVVSICLGYFALPNNFPYQGQPDFMVPKLATMSSFKRVDFLGSGLLLIATLTITAGLQEAGNRFPWKSAYVITLLVASFLFWAALLVWERYVTLADAVREPVLPWRFLTNRVVAGILLEFILLGGPLTVTIFQLPQRFQLLNDMSGLDAGIRLIPFGAAFPVGCVVGARLASNFRVPPVFIAPFGAALQIIGFALLSTLPHSDEIPSRTYGFEVLGGFGVGAVYQSLYLMIPFTTEKRDNAVGMALVSQVRMMGGVVVLAIAESVFNGHTLSYLSHFGAQGLDTRDDLTKYLAVASPETRQAIKATLAEAYNLQMVVLASCGAAQVVAALLLWTKPQIRIPGKKEDM
ncbi:putative efflux pump antibiotic resistance protein [Xylariomycetidae sp. FL2044]|nr:putative efflux pump antibiotic resistance protein [Xylariomycetidae sp. FL2044]